LNWVRFSGFAMGTEVLSSRPEPVRLEEKASSV